MARLTYSAASIISSGVSPTGYDGPLTSDELIKGATAHTAKIIEQNSDIIQTLTTALMKAKVISGYELQKILKTA